MKMKIDIDEVKKSGYTLEEVLAILQVEVRRVGQSLYYTSVKEQDTIKMTKEGLLLMNPTGVSLTTTGRELILKIIGGKRPKVKLFTKDKLNFEEFWQAFPASDKHGIWLRTRSLRSDKSKSYDKYVLAIKNGYSHEQLIKALEWEVNDRKTNSTTNNKLSYMKASITWLSQKEYEIIIEEQKTEPDVDDKDWSTSLV